MTHPQARVVRDAIVGGPHWQIVIRPDYTQDVFIDSLSSCLRMIETASVQYRGWDYPHVDGDRAPGDDYIESWCEFGSSEYWRFYQNATFVHVLTFAEDSYPEEVLAVARSRTRAPEGVEPRGYLDINGALYTLTEIFEFASRLGQRGVLGEVASVEITLKSVEGRCLVATEFGRAWREFLPATANELNFAWSGSVGDLIGDPRGPAVKAAVHFFERFGWMDPSQTFLADEQAAFVTKRQGSRR